MLKAQINKTDSTIVLKKIGMIFIHLYSLAILESSQKWIVNSHGRNKRPENIEMIPRLRWYLFSKFQCDAAKLPLFPSHFVLLVLRRSLIPLQNIPSPLNYGWESSNNSSVPIMTDEFTCTTCSNWTSCL